METGVSLLQAQGGRKNDLEHKMRDIVRRGYADTVSSTRSGRANSDMANDEAAYLNEVKKKLNLLSTYHFVGLHGESVFKACVLASFSNQLDLPYRAEWKQIWPNQVGYIYTVLYRYRLDVRRSADGLILEVKHAGDANVLLSNTYRYEEEKR